jgi:hypothetical protein
VAEETALALLPDQIIVTDHWFNGVSPKGKPLKGRTCYAVLSISFSPSDVSFNGELTDYAILCAQSAVAALHAKGMQEATEGLGVVLGMQIN